MTQNQVCNVHLIFRKLVGPQLRGEEDLEGLCKSLESSEVHGGVGALKNNKEPSNNNLIPLMEKCPTQLAFTHLVEGIQVGAPLRQ